MGLDHRYTSGKDPTIFDRKAKTMVCEELNHPAVLEKQCVVLRESRIQSSNDDPCLLYNNDFLRHLLTPITFDRYDTIATFLQRSGVGVAPMRGEIGLRGKGQTINVGMSQGSHRQ
jgi:hypothetical protein